VKNGELDNQRVENQVVLSVEASDEPGEDEPASGKMDHSH